jgi:hypothetical protein
LVVVAIIPGVIALVDSISATIVSMIFMGGHRVMLGLSTRRLHLEPA